MIRPGGRHDVDMSKQESESMARIYGAAMRWTKFVHGETPRGDFAKAQKDLMQACKRERLRLQEIGNG